MANQTQDLESLSCNREDVRGLISANRDEHREISSARVLITPEGWQRPEIVGETLRDDGW